MRSYWLGQPPIEMEMSQFLESSNIQSGWYPLVNGLCLRLWTLGWDGQMAQCKEKFGGLRFYPSGEVTDQMWQLIADAERDSYNICEFCGASPAGISKDRWWLKTLCAACDSRCRADTPEKYGRNPQLVPEDSFSTE